MKKITPLIILLIVSMLLPMVVIPVSATGNSLNYADPSSPVKVEMSASELLEYVIGGSVSELEKTYLDQTFGDVFSYSEFVPQKKVEAVYDFGTLSISAEKYEYASESGKVTFTPSTATIDGKSVQLAYSAASGKYEGKIEGLSANDGATLTVNYSTSLPISAQTANVYVNYTYDQANQLFAEEKEYGQRLETYNAYQDYLEKLEIYNEKKQAYDKYVSDKAKYDKKLEAFEKYEDDLAEYKVKLEEYKKAKEEFDKALKEFEKKKKAYETYLEEKKIYEEELKEYQIYMAEIEKFSVTLEVLDSVYVYDSQGRQLYSLLTGGTVDYVLKTMEDNMHLLEGTNVSEAQVRATGKTTAKLQTLLEGYAECSTKEQKVQYYKQNYYAISNCFSSLSSSLYYMFHDPTMHSLLYKKDDDHEKFYKFMHMLAQLHIVDTGLNDTVSRNEDWYLDGEPTFDPSTFTESYKRYGYKDLLESEHIVPDKNTSNPAALGELPGIVYEPYEPIEVEDPGEQPKDPGLTVPVEPDEVKDPGEAPAEVKDPGAAPEWTGEIPTKPELLEHTALEKELIEALNNSELNKRQPLTSDKSFTVNVQVTKALVLEEGTSIVTFYDHDGKTVLYTETFEQGEKITYGGKTPTRAETDKNKYQFEGWKNEDGALVTDLGSANESHIDFYASYKAEVKTYKITWIVNGQKTEETYPYGAIPVFGGTPSKADTEQHTYSFAGWSTPLSTVTGNATYEAVFTEYLRTYFVTWVYGSNKTHEQYRYGETPSYKLSTDGFIDGQYIYEFYGWDKEFATVKGDAVYTATFTKTPLFNPDEGGGEGGETPDPTIKVELVGDVYNVTTEENSANISTVLQFADENDNTVTVHFEKLSASVVMNEAMVAKLKAAGCNNVSIYINEENAIENALGTYSVSFTDKNGDRIDAGSVTLRLELGGKASASTKAYTVSAGGSIEPLACVFENGAVTVKLSGSAEVVLRNEYKIAASKCENGVLSTDKVNALAGETVKVSLTFSDAYELVFIKVTGVNSGEEYTLSADNTFTMPDEDVTVSAEVKVKEYTVKFVVDGVVISEAKYKKGDTVVLPEEPTKENDGKKVYTFIGWSPAVTIVTEDATYTAEFSEADLGTDRPDVNTDKTRLYTIIALGVVAVLVVVAGIPTAIVLIVKHNKKKKAKKTDKKGSEKSDE